METQHDTPPASHYPCMHTPCPPSLFATQGSKKSADAMVSFVAAETGAFMGLKGQVKVGLHQVVYNIDNIFLVFLCICFS